MNRRRLLASGIAVAGISGAIAPAQQGKKDADDRPDGTTMRFELEWDIKDDVLKVHGFLKVVQPNGAMDHKVVVLLRVTTPEGEAFPDVKLFDVDYHHKHPRDFLYPMHYMWEIDNRWATIAFVAVDPAIPHDFCGSSITR
jgi:hypothetical protein